MGLAAKFVAAVAALAVVASAMPVEKVVRLIETAPAQRKWMTEDEVLVLIQKDVGFVDVTDHQDLVQQRARHAVLAIPSDPTHQSVVNGLIPNINIATIQSNLNTFTAFNNRYYTSTTGEQSSNWLFNQVRTYAGNNANITVSQFTHTWLQKSVVARIEGSGISRDIVVIGAHQDSINGLSPVNGRAPGADDDGSGSITILEIFRVLAAANFRPEVTLEFHWYSAEEVGLRGSQAIVQNYISRGVSVRSMLQIDMDGYDRNEKRIAIITDYTSSTLNAFVRKLISAYCTIPSIDSQCGYGCSDHASWNSAGVPASFPFEQQFRNINPEIHTADDTTAYVSYDHVREFTRLGLGYIVEMSFA